jgi:hypothetical protein
VRKIWRTSGFNPWRADRVKVSPDPGPGGKIRDPVGIYASPPVVAAVSCVDETNRCKRSTAPHRPGACCPRTRPQATHGYERNGTCDHFATLNVATGIVITDVPDSHTTPTSSPH